MIANVKHSDRKIAVWGQCSICHFLTATPLDSHYAVPYRADAVSSLSADDLRDICIRPDCANYSFRSPDENPCLFTGTCAAGPISNSQDENDDNPCLMSDLRSCAPIKPLKFSSISSR